MTHENVEIDRCDTCSGVWLNESELGQIVNTRKVAFSPELITATLASAFDASPGAEGATRQSCAKCGVALSSVRLDLSSDIVLERCPKNHGIWLDKKELEKARARTEHWATEARKHRADWEELARIALDEKRNSANENAKRGLRPARYLVSSLIGKFVRS